ncbi:WD repeat-containing protein [Nitzschia inconspicua]|uniref:WD repeat-containing protein n=1 Tax=Nitzschia inconspicua TaxID=303405 RepID=A0A9K3PVJ9_9STRA|nr:WD repeat-containing protein [Nitzschia inconspicua]
MDTLLLSLINERNVRETIPFVQIHASNEQLRRELDEWKRKCENLERELVLARDNLVGEEDCVEGSSTQQQHQQQQQPQVSRSESAALRNERKIREQLERLQEQVQQQMEEHQRDTEIIQDLTKERDDLQSLQKAHDKAMSKLQEELNKQHRAIDHLTTKNSDNQQRANLAEQQYSGLKDAIRTLQQENDSLKKENRQLESRLVSEKERLSSEMNILTDMVERLKRQAEMAITLQQQEEKRKSSSWFGLSSSNTNSTTSHTVPTPTIVTNTSAEQNTLHSTPGLSTTNTSNMIPEQPLVAAIVPTEPKKVLSAHYKEASCVRYDDSGSDMLATGGSVDGTVKVWNATNGALRTTLKGGSSNAIISLDIAKHLVVGGGSDKTCRVWNFTTNHLVHHLVGHASKITSVKFFGGEQGVVTAAADRQIKVWDISRQTYRQVSTMHLHATANSIDVGVGVQTIGSGHTDGAIRLWDMRTGQKAAEWEGIHESAITSIQFNPIDGKTVLTNGMDSRLKIVDVRTGKALHVFHHEEFHTSYNWSSSSFSPDGIYVAAGSSSNGKIFIWNAKSGKLARKLEDGHDFGVCGFAWGRGGTSGQQVASVDKMGRLVLWG